MKVGIISDTHNFLDPQVPALFEGCDHIVHGGDIGLPAIIHRLEGIAPTTAVMGNTDDPAFGYRLTEFIELGPVRVLVHHIINPRMLSECGPTASHRHEDPLKARILRDKPDLVIFGHTHQPFHEVISGVRFFNPGYAGKSRFGMERSAAILHCKDKDIRPEFLKLS